MGVGNGFSCLLNYGRTFVRRLPTDICPPTTWHICAPTAQHICPQNILFMLATSNVGLELKSNLPAINLKYTWFSGQIYNTLILHLMSIFCHALYFHKCYKYQILLILNLGLTLHTDLWVGFPPTDHEKHNFNLSLIKLKLLVASSKLAFRWFGCIKFALNL